VEYDTQNPYARDTATAPRLQYLGNSKSLAAYWDSEKRSLLCLDYYYSDSKKWERINTIPSQILRHSESITATNLVQYVTAVANFGGNAVVCIGSNYDNCVIFIIENDGKITYLPEEEIPGFEIFLYAYQGKLLCWGGYVNSWSVWDRRTNTWQKPQHSDARYDFAYTAAEDKVYIFGGATSSAFGYTHGNGWIYSFKDNNWSDLPLGENAPCDRRAHGMCWTGKEIIVWGGERYNYNYIGLADGASFNPLTQKWTSLPAKNAPSARRNFACVWTGKEMIVWGRWYWDGAKEQWFWINDGAAYNPEKGSWRTIPGLD